MDALIQIAEQLGIDQSFYILFAVIAALYFILSFVYLRPFQHLFEERHAKTHGSKKSATDLVEKANEQNQRYQARLREVTESIRTTMKSAEESARNEEARLVQEAATKARESLQEVQKQLEKERAAALEKLSADVAGIAKEIATKALGRPLGTS